MFSIDIEISGALASGQIQEMREFRGTESGILVTLEHEVVLSHHMAHRLASPICFSHRYYEALLLVGQHTRRKFLLEVEVLQTIARSNTYLVRPISIWMNKLSTKKKKM